MPPHSARGFALIEALIAALLIAIAVAGLSHLVTVGLAQSLRTQQSTAAFVLAQAKLEELRGLTWRFNIDGTRASSAALAATPPDTLTQNIAGWVERLDRFGAPGAPDALTHYWRRWAITLIDAADPDTLLLQVCVVTNAAGAAADSCIWTARTRQP
jgi:type II secretory pathway pseudopilin PulG